MSASAYVIAALSLVALVPGMAHAQFPLQSAEGESTLIAKQATALVNYDVSKSRVGFSVNSYKRDAERVDAQGRPIIPNSRQWLLEFGLAATKGTRDLFKGGSFTPGFDAALTHVWTIEKKDSEGRQAEGYQQFYGRVRVDQAALKTAVFDAASLATLDTATGAELAFIGGYNNALTEDLIIGVGASVRRRWNSVHGLDPSQVCVLSATGRDKDANLVTASSCEDRYVGELPKEWATQLRSDWIWRFTSLGTEGGAIGLLGAFSADFTSDKATSFNLSLGPSIHRPGFPDQVLFATLLEGIDIGNRLGESPQFTDQLRLRVYVGIPFDVFK